MMSRKKKIIENFEEKSVSIDELVKKVSYEFGGILRSNLYETILGENELTALRKRKTLLRESLKNCGIGDEKAKEYVKGSITNMLVEKLNISEKNIDKIIPFDDKRLLSPRDKFDIALYLYTLTDGENALGVMFEEYEVGREGMDGELVDVIFSDCYRRLSFTEKLDILTQRIYASYRGLGVIDEIRDMKIDGVLGGVSGKEGTYENIWVVYKGIMIHMKFLSFETEKELIRICMNIYRYDNPGQLSRTKGYIVNQMKDHSRVVVVRPPFSESYAFFVRKFNSVEKKDIEELITDECAETVIELIKWIVKGCMVTAVTGMQGSGKTTLLMSMIEFIDPSYTLRIQEMAFELHLREVYSDRNILTLRETDDISGQEGLDLQKKTDGNVNILGEIATAPVAAWMVQMTQSGSLFTMFTHHAKTTDSLVKYLRNSLLSCHIFGDEKIALEQVIEAVRFDIHMNKSVSGHRYIERISEVVPTEDEKKYKIKDIIVYEAGRYVLKNTLSESSIEEIIAHLTESEIKEFAKSAVIGKGQDEKMAI